MLFPVLSIALFGVPNGSMAQQVDSLKAQHFLALQMGINQVKDENLHPKVSSGIGMQVSYGFEKQKRNLQQFEFVLGYSRLKTGLEELSKTVNVRIKADYSLNFGLIEHETYSLLLGPEMVLDYNVSYFPNWDDSHLYWADYLSIGVNTILPVKLRKEKEWITYLSFPLFSVFSRPEQYKLYKIDKTDVGGIISNLNSHITAAHLTNVFHVRLKTEYRFPAFAHGREAFYYAFEWVRVRDDDGLPFQKIIHQVGIKFFL